ncbi:MAG: DUF167 domain-containing protein [Nanoarchaeota archaeon]|nr:DUF167 domain-containing protein [Nanoarchaeota archaeon]
MKIYVKVKTNSSKQEIFEFGDFRYLIYLKSRPENNEANMELLKIISKHLGIPSTRIKIKSGITNNEKILETW